MKYNLEWLKRALETSTNTKFLYFWGNQPSRSGQVTSACFSQWWEAPFTVNGEVYKTAEHWMMAQKALLFGDTETYEHILKARSPGEAKALGREVKNFDEAIWVEKREEIVILGNYEKFDQHKELKQFLLSTKNRVLVEASPVDIIWGIGLTADDEKAGDPHLWQGLNLLGFALMETRDRLTSSV